MRDKLFFLNFLYILIKIFKLGDSFINQKIFNFNGIKIKLHHEVYDPAEDSFQLIESIRVNKNDEVFEIGTGCGLIALECLRLGANVVCSDVNPYSIDLVKENYYENESLLKGSIDVRLGDLFSVLKNNEKFDVIIFNPPYLPIEKEDIINKDDWIDIATNGGVDGLELIERFIVDVNKYLKENGKAFFVFSSLSDHDKLNYLLKNNSLYGKIVSSCKYDDEILEVYVLSN